ncbi:Ankyrin repeat domain-containing protein 33B [Plecturocebus cupreus]
MSSRASDPRRDVRCAQRHRRIKVKMKKASECLFMTFRCCFTEEAVRTQLGQAAVTHYSLNFVPVLVLKGGTFGFSALMKAAMQGPTDGIRALMLARRMSTGGTPR